MGTRRGRVTGVEWSGEGREGERDRLGRGGRRVTGGLGKVTGVEYMSDISGYVVGRSRSKWTDCVRIAEMSHEHPNCYVHVHTCVRKYQSLHPRTSSTQWSSQRRLSVSLTHCSRVLWPTWEQGPGRRGR